MTNIKQWFKIKAAAICDLLEKNILSNKSLKCKVVFGPIRSRRLGYVLGVNNIKPNVCSYNCIYCSSGNKNCCSICTNSCLSPFELHLSVKNKLNEIEKLNKKIDYIVFTGSGEPALDTELSKEISILRDFGYKIAVFTNASLIWNNHIKENIKFADYVSVKIDTVNPETWHKINRPHKRLRYDLILDGIKTFSKEFRGTLSTETTIVKNINDNNVELGRLSEYLNTLNRAVSYFTVPIFPPEINYAVSPEPEDLEHLKIFIKDKISKSTLLCCPTEDEFIATDDFENELLGLLSIHPISKEAVKHYIKNNIDSNKLKEMIDKRIIREVEFAGKHYYMENMAS
ncbi:MAG: radical SAM protein [Ignavibacteria bacterium]